VIEDESQKDQMLFTRLMSIALSNNFSMRNKIKELSKQKNNLFYEEILIKNLLLEDIGGETVNDYLKSIVEEEGENLEINNYNTFISNLMDDLPLLVVKIPDWLININWNTETIKPKIFSNLYCKGQKVFGFENDGACYTKNEYYKSEHFELVIKNSEDYFMLKNIDLLRYFQHPCMSIDDFVKDYCQVWDGVLLVKKRDLQRFYGNCAPEYRSNSQSVNSNCPRQEGEESNYMTGFKLATPEILQSLHNDVCIAGEETFDFQVDFHYGIRTGEDEIDLTRHLTIPLYGIRYAELINPDGSVRLCDIFSDFKGKALDFTYFIDKQSNGWDFDKYGNNIIVLWNEVDILSCGNNKYFNQLPLHYTYNFPLGFSGKDEFDDAKYMTSKRDFFNKSGIIFGQNMIKLGWNNYAYCEKLKSESSTGLNGLKVNFEISLH